MSAKNKVNIEYLRYCEHRKLFISFGPVLSLLRCVAVPSSQRQLILLRGQIKKSNVTSGQKILHHVYSTQSIAVRGPEFHVPHTLRASFDSVLIPHSAAPHVSLEIS